MNSLNPLIKNRVVAEKPKKKKTKRKTKRSPDYIKRRQEKDRKKKMIKGDKRKRIRERDDKRKRIREREDKRKRIREREDKRVRERTSHYNNTCREFMSSLRSDYGHQIRAYEAAIRLGPDTMCYCCGGLFFENKIKFVERDEFETLEPDFKLSVLQLDEGFEELQFCQTCYKYIILGKIPRLCLGNGLDFPSIPSELEGLNEVEERMVAPRLPFMKIQELGSGKQFGLKGNVVNVPIEIKKSIDVLPRSFDKMDTIQIKLKRMCCHKSTYIESFISPQNVFNAAKYLCDQELYKNEGIHLSIDWSTFHNQVNEAFIVDPADKEESNPVDVAETVDNFDETAEDEPLNVGDDETLLKQGIIFAPGEGQTPTSLLSDKYVEELSFPTIYCGQKRDLKVKMSYNDIVKSELRRYDRRSCKPPKIFFMYRNKELRIVKDAIKICLRQRKSFSGFKASDFLDERLIGEMLKEDSAYKVLKDDRSSPSYWQSRMRDLMSMVRQLGIPTFFMTLSAAETHWEELLIILSKVLHNRVITPEEARALSFQEKCELIRKDPVTCSRYFDHRIRELLKLLMAKNGIFKDYELVDFYYRIEFQFRGSPHLHLILWLNGAPIYDTNNPLTKALAEAFIDGFITTTGCAEAQHLKKYQFHKHSHSCKRRLIDTTICRFGIPYFPMRKTQILEPLPNDELSDKEFEEFPDILDKIIEIINEIDLSIKPRKDTDFDESQVMNFEQFLEKIAINEDTYIRVIRNSLKRAQVLLKRKPKDIRINAFNSEILLRHRANMDLQFILNPYSCVHYILNYINKSNRGMSALLRDVIKEHKSGNLTHFQKLNMICNYFINCSEVSAPEAVYILLSLHLSQSTRSTIFINTGRKEERVKILKSKEKIESLEQDSTDIMEEGLLDHYSLRPVELESVCLAVFAAKYNFSKQKKQLIIEDNNEIEAQNTEVIGKAMKLMGNKGYVKERKKLKVIRYRKYQVEKEPQDFYREKVMLYMPWRDEDVDILAIDCKKRYFENLVIINEIQKQFVHNLKDDLDEIRESVETDYRLETLRTNEEPEDSPEHAVFDLQDISLDIQDQFSVRSENPTCGTFASPTVICEDVYSENIRKLNEKQKNFLLGLVNHVKTSVTPFYYYLSGGAGTGKSCLINAIYQTLVRHYKNIGNPDDIKVMLTGPTGKSAFNIRGTTIHAALGITVSQNNNVSPLSADKLNTMRSKLWHLKVIIIDEVSMVGYSMLRKVDQKLKEIFDRNSPFGGKSILFVGDLNQLRPVQDSYVFQTPKVSDYSILSGSVLWSQVKHYELTEIMRQKGDKVFAEALTRLASGDVTASDMEMFRSRLMDKDCKNIPQTAIRLFAENRNVDVHNRKAVNEMPGDEIISEAYDYSNAELPKRVKDRAIYIVKNMNTQKTMGLPNTLILKLGIRYMVTTNVDVVDGLVNGTTGRLCKIDFIQKKSKEEVKLLWFDFGDPSVGIKARTKYRPLIVDNTVLTPIEKVTRDIQTKTEAKIVLVSRRQFPLVIAEAMTIHKSQGQTYDEVVVDLVRLDLSKMYTAFSRAKTLEGLYLTGAELKTPKARLETHPVSVELKRLREEAKLVFNIKFENSKLRNGNNILVFCHNQPYLYKHVEDITTDFNIMSADMLFFIEVHASDAIIQGYQLRHQIISGNKRPFGIAVYSRPSVEWLLTSCLEDIRFSKGAHLEALIIKSVPRQLIWIVVYISPKYPKSKSITDLMEIVKTHSISKFELVVMGDLNIDAKSTDGEKLELEFNKAGLYTAIENNYPSTDYNTRIDWVMTNRIQTDAHFYESLTSDHKPIFLTLEGEHSSLEIF